MSKKRRPLYTGLSGIPKRMGYGIMIVIAILVVSSAILSVVTRGAFRNPALPVDTITKTVTTTEPLPTTSTSTTIEPVVTTTSSTSTTTTSTTTPPTTTTTTTVVYEDGVQGSCILLEERWCGTGVLVEWTRDFAGPEGGRVTVTIPAVAFELPPGTPIFAPADGEALYQATVQTNPSRLSFKEYEVAFTASFVRSLESPKIDGFWELVREGEVLGLVSQFSATGGRGEVDPPGNYNLIVHPRLSSERLEEIVKYNDQGEIIYLDPPDIERQLDLSRWFWEGWFGMEAQPFAIEP